MTKLTKDQLRSVAWGACFLASGGGGALLNAEQFLQVLPDEWSVDVIDATEAAPDKIAAVIAYIGAPTAIGSVSKPVAALNAFDELNALCQESQQQSISYLVPVEIGAISTLVACIVASAKGIPVVDADGAGRAVPALTMLTLSSLNPNPLVLASSSGIDVNLKTKSVSIAEDLSLSVISSPSFGYVAGLGIWPMQASAFDQVLPIRGTLSLCNQLGDILRHAQTPVPAARKLIDANGYTSYILAQGRVTKASSQIEGSLDVGEIVIQTQSGDTVTVLSTNENLIAWSSKRNTPLVIGPDLACYVSAAGQPYSNADFVPSKLPDDLFLIGAAAPKPLLEKPILTSFQSYIANVGYAGAYVPIAKLAESEPAYATA